MIRLFYLKLLFFNCTLFFSCSRPDKTNEIIGHEIILKNKVKKITEYKSIVHLGIVEKEQIINFKFFNEKGYLIKEKLFSSNGNTESVINYEYNINNNLVQKIGLDSINNLLFKETQSYDKNNNRIELFFYLPDKTYKYRNIAVYDNLGRMIELDWYWPTGLKAINKYKYDGSNKTEDVEYNPEGKFQYNWIYKYDFNNNLTEAIQFYPGKIINSKIVYSYNSENLLIKQVNYFGESIQNVITLNYDCNQLLQEKTEYSSSGRILAKYKYKYEFY